MYSTEKYDFIVLQAVAIFLVLYTVEMLKREIETAA